jgi:hypothetical protein
MVLFCFPVNECDDKANNITDEILTQLPYIVSVGLDTVILGLISLKSTFYTEIAT